jgi:meso-butanediol dehydrogenase/(S,S)-butanediol dehydrogenase/diacetyl reductase
LITGGGQGIVEAIAERLHADGFKVAIADLNIEPRPASPRSLAERKAARSL